MYQNSLLSSLSADDMKLYHVMNFIEHSECLQFDLHPVNKWHFENEENLSVQKTSSFFLSVELILSVSVSVLVLS
jgi:hypothetical protein